MSVTFSTLPAAPRKTTPCQFCEQERKQAAEEGREPDVNEHGGCCDPWCNGLEEMSEAPEPNFANGNTSGILHLLGLSTELWGEAPVSTIRQGLLRAFNTDRSDLVCEPSDLPAGHAGTAITKDEDGLDRIERRGCQVICFGNTDEQTTRRLHNIQDLCQWAEENDRPTICWG